MLFKFTVYNVWYTSGAVFDLVLVAKSRTMGVLRVHGGTADFVYNNWDAVCVQ